MGYDNENAERIVIDIETVASPDARQYLEPVEAPANYKDPVKIEAYCREKFEQRVLDAGLEADLCEVAAVGFMWGETDDPAVVYTRQEWPETELLRALWDQVGNRVTVGFCTLRFDLPALVRRSQLLGVRYPRLNLDRYRTPHIDLAEYLSFHGSLTWRSLGFYLRRFGIPHHDMTTGADVARMVAEGDWLGVVRHCTADVEGTAALARRLGLLLPVSVQSIAAPVEMVL